MALPTGEYRTISRLALLRALLWSLLIHGLIFAPSPRLPDKPRVLPGQGVLRASLRGPTIMPHSAPLVASGKPLSEDVPALVPPRQTSQVGAAGNGTPLPAAPTGAEALDAEGLRSYRMALAVGSRQYWRYPDGARQAGLAGTATLQIAVLPLGGVKVSVAQSSGHPVLDEAALAMVAQSARQALLPESLQGKAFSLMLPVSFSPGP